MLLALTLFGANLLPGQGTPQKSALAQLSGSIRELTDRASPAVVEVIANGYSRKDPRESTRLGLLLGFNSLEEVHEGSRIVTRLVHVLQAQLVGLRLELARLT
jgi:hypothetical protein